MSLLPVLLKYCPPLCLTVQPCIGTQGHLLVSSSFVYCFNLMVYTSHLFQQPDSCLFVMDSVPGDKLLLRTHTYKARFQEIEDPGGVFLRGCGQAMFGGWFYSPSPATS